MRNFFFHKRIFNIKIPTIFSNLFYRDSPGLFVFNTLAPPFFKRSKLTLLNRFCFRIRFLPFWQFVFPVPDFFSRLALCKEQEICSNRSIRLENRVWLTHNSMNITLSQKLFADSLLYTVAS